MGTAYFRVVFAILASISSSLGIKDMCDTPTEGIKAVRIVSQGEKHCMFQLPNDNGTLKGRLGEYCFHIDEARRACGKYGAGLLTLSSDLIKHMELRFEEITPAGYGLTGVYYLLGVKELHTTGKLTISQHARKISIKFNMTTIETNEQEYRVFGTKTWTMKSASEDAVSYLSIPCTGSNTSAEPAIYSYSPSHQQSHPVFILCHQKVEKSSTIHDNQCSRDNIAAGTAIYVKTTGLVHCIFRPIEEPDAVTKPVGADPNCTSCYLVNMTVASAICKNHSAHLLNVVNAEMFDAMVTASKLLFKQVQGTISILLGATIKIHGAENVNFDIPTYNITWDNGKTENANDLLNTGMFPFLKNRVHTRVTKGTAFYEPKDNMIYVVNPADIDSPVAVVCHQDPNYPFGVPTTHHPTGPHSTGPPGPHTTGPPGPHTTGPPGPHTTGPPGPHTTGPPGPHTTRPPGPHTTGPPGPHTTGPHTTGPPGPHTTRPPGPHTTGPPGPHTTGPPGPHTTGPPPTRPPGSKTTGPPAIKGTSTTSAANPTKPFNALIMGIFIALATVASTKTLLVKAFRVRVTAT